MQFAYRACDMYLSLSRSIWNHLPPSFQLSPIGKLYGRHLHSLVLLRSERQQSFGTFFLRNRTEIGLMCRLLNERPQGAHVNLCVLACSKGAELYSILWAIRSSRPDLKLRVRAVDISQEILEFARAGVYTPLSRNPSSAMGPDDPTPGKDVIFNTWRDQNAPIFERVTDEELEMMCVVKDAQVSIREWLKEDITWVVGDAGTRAVIDAMGPQDMVIANRFLCHMKPENADRCLQNVAQLVRPGGYLFVSGVDLDVRARVAQRMGWEPVTEMIREVHDGDPSLLKGWPLEYWGLEPFSQDRADWKMRYASVFRLGQPAC